MPAQCRITRRGGTLIGAIAVVALLSAVPEARGQADSREPIILDHADQVSIERLDSGNVYFARGNVHLVWGRSELWAQRAVRYEYSGDIHLFGSVRVVDTAESIRADSIFYYPATDLARAWGNVQYERTRGDLVATSLQAEYNRRDKWAKLYDSARVVSGADRPEARIETFADTLLLYSGSDSAEAWGHVRVRRSDGDATAERAVFTGRGDSNRVMLTGSPAGKFGTNNVSGDTLHLWIVNDQMRELMAAGDARATYRESSDSTGRTTESEITSRQMRLLFADGALSDLMAVGQARSRYVPASGLPGEHNDASGDTVKIAIADSTVKRVQVIAGAEGTYYTPKIEGNEVRIDTVYYRASYIDYHVDDEWIRLWDRAEIQYGTLTLEAGQVLYQTGTDILRAYALRDALLAPPEDYHPPVKDTSNVDSAAIPARRLDSISSGLANVTVPMPADTATRTAGGAKRDTLQLPVLRDGAQEVRGLRLAYDLNSQRGRIVQSATHTEDGYYRGGDFRKETADIFYAQDGRYTTCDLDQPHFEFTGNEMKIKKDDRVVARPVVLRIEKLPVLWIPYYVFSIRKDRHSGLLPIRFGNFQQGSRYIDNLGYYFAVSDYFDFAPAMDIKEGQGIFWRLSASYALRYKLNGSVSGTYNRHNRVTSVGEQRTEQWNFRFYHSQQINPTTSLSGSGNFVSNTSFYQNYTADLEDRLNRSLRSQINLSKRWRNASLALAMDDTRNLDNDSRTSTLPSLIFSLPARQIFSPRKLKGGRTEESRWYHNFRLGYSNSGANRISTYGSNSTLPDRHYATLDHRASLTFSTKALDVISLTPAVSAQETWYYIFDVDGAALPPGVAANTAYRRMAGNASISAQTNLYGVFNINKGALLGFRHVLTPSLSFRYSPAVVKHDAVRSYTGVGGGGARSAVMGIGVSNLFQMKTKGEKDERRYELLTVNSGTSYNFEARERKLGLISTSLRSGLLRNPDLSLSMTHDPYDPVTKEIDYTPRLASILASISFRLRSQGAAPLAGAYGDGVSVLGEELNSTTGGTEGKRGWSMQTSYQFAENRSVLVSGSNVTTVKSITHWIKTSIQVSPTPLWEVQTSVYYDIRNKAMSDWSIRINRDLHCWAANFSWVPTGPRSGYYFRIFVKALPDVKYEKSESAIPTALFQ